MLTCWQLVSTFIHVCFYSKVFTPWCWPCGFHTTWSPALGTLYLVGRTQWLDPSIWYLVPRPWHLVPSSWHLIPSTWYQVLGSMFQVQMLGTKGLGLGSKLPVLGTKCTGYLVTRAWYWAPSVIYLAPSTQLFVIYKTCLKAHWLRLFKHFQKDSCFKVETSS